jgi:hypothetical protein
MFYAWHITNVIAQNWLSVYFSCFSHYASCSVYLAYIKKYFLNILNVCRTFICRGRRGRDRMVVGFITTYAISAYHH